MDKPSRGCGPASGWTAGGSAFTRSEVEPDASEQQSLCDGPLLFITRHIEHFRAVWSTAVGDIKPTSVMRRMFVLDPIPTSVLVVTCLEEKISSLSIVIKSTR